MTDIDLAAIRKRLEIAEKKFDIWILGLPSAYTTNLAAILRQDVPALLAEVERLRAAMERAFRDAVDTPADAEAALGYALYGAEWESR